MDGNVIQEDDEPYYLKEGVPNVIVLEQVSRRRQEWDKDLKIVKDLNRPINVIEQESYGITKESKINDDWMEVKRRIQNQLNRFWIIPITLLYFPKIIGTNVRYLAFSYGPKTKRENLKFNETPVGERSLPRGGGQHSALTQYNYYLLCQRRHFDTVLFNHIYICLKKLVHQ